MTSEDPPQNLLGRAKAAKDAAQSSVTGFASRAGDAMASTAGDLKSQVAAKAGELNDASAAQLVNTIESFNTALPILREAGYTLSSLDVSVGLPPKVTAGFVVSAEVSTETIEQIVAEHADKKLLVLVVRSLHQAWQIQTKIKIGGLRPKGLSVALGLIPEVSVKFA